jgi:GAF domain-containing protein
MEQSPSAAGVAVHSLLSLLADGAGRNAALSLLHQRALQVTGGTVSLLFEHHAASGQMQATSGAGIETLPIGALDPQPAEATVIAQAFTGRVPVAIDDAAVTLPTLHAQVGTDDIILLPLLTDTRRIGLLAIGIAAEAHVRLPILARSDVPAGFLVAIELSRLRQREEFEREVRLLLDAFSDSLATTLDLAQALEQLCVAATALFAGDRTTVWLHQRETRALVAVASSDPAFTRTAEPVRTDDPIAAAAVALRSQRAGLATNPPEATSLLTVPLRGCRRALGTVVCEGVRVEPGDGFALLNRADELGRQLSGAVETMQLLGVVTRSGREQKP